MEILLPVLDLGGPGGMQTYVMIVAAHLERLGHGVTLFSPRLGPVAEQARARGLRVCGSEDELPDACDAVLSSDGASALEMASRYPEAVRGLIVHGADYDLHLPPGILGVVSFAVAMNDVVSKRVRTTVTRPDVARLTQPIDIAHFYPGYAPRERPRRILLLGNYLQGSARQALVSACERSGASWRQVGLPGEVKLDPFAAILEADVVVGQGRAALEGMACGRAVWIYGPSGGDGWVTEDNYPELEQDGFRGRAGVVPVSAERFEQDLAEYRLEMGDMNRRLVVRHHSPYVHAVALSELLEGHRPSAPPGNTPLREMARLVRSQHDAQARLAPVLAELADAHGRLAAAEARIAGAEASRAAAEAERRRSEAELGALLATRRWRASSRVAAPLDRLRTRMRG